MKKNLFHIFFSVVVLIALAFGGFFLAEQGNEAALIVSQKNNGGLSIVWGDIGKRLVDAGVIDKEKLKELYRERGGLGDAEEALLRGDIEKMEVNEKNAGYVLNLLWAFGLANKNPILEEGPMQSYGDPGRFASTGGWTLAKGSPMEHYARHALISLTPEEQELVERVAKNIYRPCCNNSTYFPDCNHGMAMLGFLELAASGGASEEEMYRDALVLNRFWFPDTYAAVDEYLKIHNMSLDAADPKTILGADFSSGSGYQKILTEITPPSSKQGGSCGV